MTSAAGNSDRISADAGDVGHNADINPFAFQPAGLLDMEFETGNDTVCILSGRGRCYAGTTDLAKLVAEPPPILVTAGK